LSPYNDFLRSKFITRFLGHVFPVHVLRTLCARSDGAAMHWDSCGSQMEVMEQVPENL
jgi:hypothetical protein